LVVAEKLGNRSSSSGGEVIVRTTVRDDATRSNLTVTYRLSSAGKGTKITVSVSSSLRGPAATAASLRGEKVAAGEIGKIRSWCEEGDWKAEAATAVGRMASSDSPVELDEMCATIGGRPWEGSMSRLTIPGWKVFTGSFPVAGCRIDRYSDDIEFNGIVRASSGGKLWFTATLIDGRTQGPVWLWNTETGLLEQRIEMRDSYRHGEALYFDEEGEPLRFIYFQRGEEESCAGACGRYPYSELTEVPEATFGQYQAEDFLRRTGTAREREQAELMAEAAAREARLARLESERQARLTRSRACSSSGASGVAETFVKKRGCTVISLESASLMNSGYYQVRGEAACEERVDWLDRTLLVVKRFSIQVVPAEGEGCTYWNSGGVYVYDK